MQMPNAVKELRALYGESQQAFSNRLGIALNSVSRYETGESRPAARILLKLGQLAREKGRQDLKAIFAFGGMMDGELGSVAREMITDLRRGLKEIEGELACGDIEAAKAKVKDWLGTADDMLR